MKKNSLLIVLLLTSITSISQKNQRIAYIDMEYILQNIPQYIQAQNTLNDKVEKWKKKLDKETRAIEVLKTDLVNEKAILTKELIEEREEDIKIKGEALRRLESLYFGPNGNMYNLRKQLIQPVQDQVYNAVQNIVSRKKYDFVFDKSSELVMLYSNKKYDISDLIVKLINIDQRKQDRKDKIAAKKELLKNNNLSEEQQVRLAKKEASRKKNQENRLARIRKIEETRKARLKKRADARKLLVQKKAALKKVQKEARNEKVKKQKENN